MRVFANEAEEEEHEEASGERRNTTSAACGQTLLHGCVYALVQGYEESRIVNGTREAHAGGVAQGMAGAAAG